LVIARGGPIPWLVSPYDHCRNADVATVVSPCASGLPVRPAFPSEHANAMLWTQSEACTGSTGSPPPHAPETSRDRGQQENGFHHRKRRSNALPGAPTEREVGEFRKFQTCFGTPAAWVELFRVREESCIAVHHPLAHHEVRPYWNLVATEFKVADRLASHGQAGG